VLVADPQGTVLLARRRAAELFGHQSPEALTGQSILALVALTDRERARETLRPMAAGEPWSRSSGYTLQPGDGGTVSAAVRTTLPAGVTVLATTTRRCTMAAELVECWLCETTIAPDAALIRYRDEQGKVHPWADRRGRWQPEYICQACVLVYPDCTEYDWSGAAGWWWLAARRSSDTAGDEALR